VAREAVGTDQVTFNGHVISLAPPYRRVSLREGARESASKKLGVEVADGDLRNRDSAAGLASKLHLEIQPSWGAGKIATEIFERLNEDSLLQPTFVHDFPTEVSPLSKQRADDPDTVERFELYIGGFEVANAFSELNDRPSSGGASRRSSRTAPPAIRKRTRWTRTTSARSSTAFRPPAAKAWASIASSCCSPTARRSGT
jgi:lysyl-tRNA synthetase class II